MRITLVCDYSLDYVGGAQTAFIEQVRTLRDAGHDVLVVGPGGGPTDIGGSVHEWIAAHWRVPVVDLPLIRNTPALRARITLLLSQHGTQVVHIHSEFGISAGCIDVARTLGIPVVHTVHTFFWRASLPGPLSIIAAAGIARFHTWLTGISRPTVRIDAAPADSALRAMTLAVAQRADVVVSPSAHQREALLAAGLEHVRTLVNTVQPGSAVHGGPLTHLEGPLRLVWVGRCVAEKRLLEFVAACVCALDDLPAGCLEIEIVGDGPLLAAARRMGRGHAAITFAGLLAPLEVRRRLAAGHLAALTSFGFDNQPMTVVEALRAARGVLYVDPRLAEGLDMAGILASDESVAGMASTLRSLAVNPDRVIRASRRAERAFALFDPATFACGLRDIYDDALGVTTAAR